MSIKNKVVLHNPTTKKHEPLASGDVLAGSIIQVSTDAGNSLQLGTDGGLKVEAAAYLPDDQVLTGDNSGSVSLTLTPSTQPNGDVNYTIKGEVKIDPAEDNAAVATADGVYVPTPTVPTYDTGNAPAVVDDGTTTTQYFGGNSIALGNPVGWEKRAGTTKVYPVYDEGSVGDGATIVGDGATSVCCKQTEFGTQEATTESYQTHVITFATAFPTVPFVTLTSSIQGDLWNWQALDITTTGFTLEGITTTGSTLEGYVFVVPGFAGNVNWKAEEK